VRNPMNPHQVSRVSLRPEDVDGVVFWTKNAAPMLNCLEALGPWPFCFQYTLTGYGADAEAGLPGAEERLNTFRELSDRIGPERTLWRYDPILLNDRYTGLWHYENFEAIARTLKGYTNRVTISFVDVYSRNRGWLDALKVRLPGEDEMREIARAFAAIAAECGMKIFACSEPLDFSACGVLPAKCIDAGLLGRIGGISLREEFDANQRKHCGCAPSIDIGAYNTCPNGCLYCYANYSAPLLKQNLPLCDPESPLLCGRVGNEDVVRERRLPSLREIQIRMSFEEDNL